MAENTPPEGNPVKNAIFNKNDGVKDFTVPVKNEQEALKDLLNINKDPLHRPYKGEFRDVLKRHNIEYASPSYFRVAMRHSRYVKNAINFTQVKGENVQSNNAPPHSTVNYPQPPKARRGKHDGGYVGEDGKVNFHFDPWEEARLENPEVIPTLLPKRGKNWFGVVDNAFTLKAFKGGKVYFYIKDSAAARPRLVKYLTELKWQGVQIAALLENLHKNGINRHIAFMMPGVNSHTLPERVYGDGMMLVKVRGDETPYRQGTLEVEVSTPNLEDRMKMMEDSLKLMRSDFTALPRTLAEQLGLVMAGLPTADLAVNMMAVIQKQGERLQESIERQIALEQTLKSLREDVGHMAAPSGSAGSAQVEPENQQSPSPDVANAKPFKAKFLDPGSLEWQLAQDHGILPDDHESPPPSPPAKETSPCESVRAAYERAHELEAQKTSATSQAAGSPGVQEEEAPNPNKCPKCSKGLDGWYCCGVLRVYTIGGGAEINPFPCLNGSFRSCLKFNINATGGYGAWVSSHPERFKPAKND